MSHSPVVPVLGSLTDQISSSISTLYAAHYSHPRATTKTYVNDKTVLCLIQESRSKGEEKEFAQGHGERVMDRRVAFQVAQEDAFTEEIERITGCNVVAFLSANQDGLDFAAELFILDRPPAVS